MSVNIPDEFLCPITRNTMKEPVSLPCGHTFEKEALENWIRQKNDCPSCRKPITGQMTINWSLKSLIDRLLNKTPRENSNLTIMNVSDFSAGTKKIIDNLQSELSKIKATYFEEESKINLQLDVPKCENGRRPVSFVCLIDISGSMDDIVGAAEGGKAFTRLDLVKHVLNVLVASLTVSDQLALVTFSDNSDIVLELCNMTKENKILAKNYIKSFHTTGGTNTLPGIHMCYELIKSAPKTNIQSILLLTDGQDTVGKDLLIRGFKTIEKDSMVQFNTFGISNDIWSDCLSEIAVKGRGLFGFIPDQTMIGTVFVNFIANTFGIFGQGIMFSLSKGFEFENGDFKKEITLSYGKSRNFLIKKNSEYNSNHPLKIKLGLGLSVKNSNNQIEQTPMVKLKPQEIHDKSKLDFNIARNKILELCLNPQLPNVTIDDYVESNEINKIKEFALEFKQFPNEFNNNNEQIKLGVQYWNTWGQHYIRSFAYAHLYEMCLNFKSPSMTVYRNPQFDEIVDKLTDLFCTIPPPIPSAISYGNNMPHIGNMSSIMNENNGCILSTCMLKLADQTFKKVGDLKKGDLFEDGSRIICVIKSKYTGKLVKLNNLTITPYHPIFYEDKWQFPIELLEENLKKNLPNPYFKLIESGKSEWVCNLVLDKNHLATIENFKCVTLGHGFQDDVVKHPYYGTNKVIEDLSKLGGWNDGLIILNSFEVKRDENLLVTGMVLEKVK